MKKNEPRTLEVDYLTRVEGEASLTVRLEGDRATDVRLAIFEPPRFFEALLRGRSYLEAPDITSRICGICPVAYLTSACLAMEDALGVTVEGPLRALRRLLYCGEWIESHGLHVFLLHAPDFLGYPDALSMAKQHGEWVQRGLRIKKAGNSLVALMGGRAIHPINVRVGGFYRAPTRAELESLLPELRWGHDATGESLEWMARFPFPELERDYEFVSLRHPDEYPIAGGRVVSSEGLDIDVRDWDAHFVEEQVPYTNALHARRVGRGAYLCGPLARFNLNFDRLHPSVREAARRAGLSVPCRNPFRALLVRLVEMLQAFTEAIRLIEAYEAPTVPHVDTPSRAATGYGASEAPRGLLYHRYTLDADGTIQDARIVPPTSQNQRSIEDDLRVLAPQLASRAHAEATRLAEQAIRNHDPCISCATHFLTLKVERT
ncbi:dehydrogenase [Cystobacter fuscus]|uniref:Dehydrogenase n=1 Tax=Cystobacter fuscus TaxID=43 RepID=A0A250ITW6_9BACT|nr:Ni/Fe hydrogenase subunit alpha [Cystobacter fuscus]ATB35195.1 dehydrogenase [Cystobacter fuscus]